ncbi:hypothetical protein B0H10DRAFT_2167227 [Mycena sp. CBHHK59/15]|nr:hypothetical protein B0H10DRAFT_2167227 [Mycena sp. CBHHK59/15]
MVVGKEKVAKTKRGNTPSSWTASYSLNVKLNDSRDYDDSYQPRDKYNRNNSVGNVYSHLGEKFSKLDEDCAALFSGYNAEKAGSGQEQPPGEENVENVEGIKKQTRYVKQGSVNSMRNTPRLACEAEDIARNTLNRLGTQPERLANSERHLDIAKGHSTRTDDKTNKLNQLNRSIFHPEAKLQARYEDGHVEREKAMLDIRETQNRLGQAQTYERDDAVRDELVGSARRGRFRSDDQISVRKEQWKCYQFESAASDVEIKDELNDNLNEIGDNGCTYVIEQKTAKLGNKIVRNTDRVSKFNNTLIFIYGLIILQLKNIK